MTRRPLSATSARVRAAMYGQESFWDDGVARLLRDGEGRICYATYELQGGAESLRSGEIHTMFLTTQRVFWCELEGDGQFTGDVMAVEHANVTTVATVGGRGLVFQWRHSDGGECSFYVLCRKSASARVVHRLMLQALDVTLGRPPYMRASISRDGMVRCFPGRPKPPLR